MDQLEDRRLRRTEAAALDVRALADWAATEGLHLVIDEHTARRFALTAEHLPPGTVDARDRDSVTVALGDPTALLLTAGGHHWGLPVGAHVRWGELLAGGGTYGVLVVSALTGSYYGLHVDGANHERFVGGRREERLGVEAVVECADGSRVEIIRTTLGCLVITGQDVQRADDLAAALARIDGAITSVGAPTHDEADLAAALERARALPAREVALNGQVWRRRPALVPD